MPKLNDTRCGTAEAKLTFSFFFSWAFLEACSAFFLVLDGIVVVTVHGMHRLDLSQRQLGTSCLSRLVVHPPVPNQEHTNSTLESSTSTLLVVL